MNQKAQKWCMDRGYKIYPTAVDKESSRGRSIAEFHIIVRFNNEVIKSKKTYTQKEWPDVIWSMYEWFYNKYAEKEERV